MNGDFQPQEISIPKCGISNCELSHLHQSEKTSHIHQITSVLGDLGHQFGIIPTSSQSSSTR